MRILFSSLRPPFPLRFAAGGQRSTHELLSYASRNTGADVEALVFCPADIVYNMSPPKKDWKALGILSLEQHSNGYKYTLNSYSINIITSYDSFWSALDIELSNSLKPIDVVLTQQSDAILIVEFARKRLTPTVLFVDTVPALSVATVDNLISAQSHGCAVIACSKYLKDVISSHLGEECFWMYPMFSKSQPISGANLRREYLTLVNPIPEKGQMIGRYIARHLPDQQFLFVRGWHNPNDGWRKLKEEMRQLKNVKFQEQVTEISEVLNKTKLLLVPSQIEETFGRIAWEAARVGVPVLASAIGGLPEAVGDRCALVTNYTSPVAWLHRIVQIISSEKAMRQLSRSGMRHTSSNIFSKHTNFGRFLTSCEAARRLGETSFQDKRP